jgi:hypothetical protein
MALLELQRERPVRRVGSPMRLRLALRVRRQQAARRVAPVSVPRWVLGLQRRRPAPEARMHHRVRQDPHPSSRLSIRKLSLP